MHTSYTRVSTNEHSFTQQREALSGAGCKLAFEDQVSGAAIKRPGLGQIVAQLGKDDVLVVWKLDRLGRFPPHLINVITELDDLGASFRSLSEAIDTKSAGGRLFFRIIDSRACGVRAVDNLRAHPRRRVCREVTQPARGSPLSPHPYPDQPRSKPHRRRRKSNRRRPIIPQGRSVNPLLRSATPQSVSLI